MFCVDTTWLAKVATVPPAGAMRNIIPGSGSIPIRAPDNDGAQASDPSGVNIFKSVEKLGLKLEKGGIRRFFCA